MVKAIDYAKVREGVQRGKPAEKGSDARRKEITNRASVARGRAQTVLQRVFAEEWAQILAAATTEVDTERGPLPE